MAYGISLLEASQLFVIDAIFYFTSNFISVELSSNPKVFLPNHFVSIQVRCLTAFSGMVDS